MHQSLVRQQQIVIIPKGASLHSISAILSRQAGVKNASVWFFYSRVTGWSRKLHAGEYLVPAGSDGLDLLSLFASGKVIQHRITLLAGMTIKEVMKEIAGQPKLVDDVKGLEGKDLLNYLHIQGRSPEGLFYPDTYFYTADSKASSVLKQANKRLEEVLSHAWESRADKLPYQQPYDVLIMASIIEKETGVPGERAEIAGVFVRRLNKGMRLQSDPTVIYGMGDRFNGKITRKDLREKNPYNTYRINGLPPTPIALVNKEDIGAAVHPAAGTALYFVATGNGDHVFSDTLAQQRKAIRKYQLKRKKNYRSSPVMPGENEVSDERNVHKRMGEQDNGVPEPGKSGNDFRAAR